jgi:hypothetical protein
MLRWFENRRRMREHAREEEQRNSRAAEELIRRVDNLLQAHTGLSWSHAGNIAPFGQTDPYRAYGVSGNAGGLQNPASPMADQIPHVGIFEPHSPGRARAENSAFRELQLQTDASSADSNGAFAREFSLLLRLMHMRYIDPSGTRGDSALALLLPRFAVERGSVLGGSTTCPICLEEYHGEVIMLPCLCAGHTECMLSAMKHDVRCPTHRIDIRAQIQLQPNDEEGMENA